MTMPDYYYYYLRSNIMLAFVLWGKPTIDDARTSYTVSFYTFALTSTTHLAAIASAISSHIGSYKNGV